MTASPNSMAAAPMARRSTSSSGRCIRSRAAPGPSPRRPRGLRPCLRDGAGRGARRPARGDARAPASFLPLLRRPVRPRPRRTGRDRRRHRAGRSCPRRTRGNLGRVGGEEEEAPDFAPMPLSLDLDLDMPLGLRGTRAGSDHLVDPSATASRTLRRRARAAVPSAPLAMISGRCDRDGAAARDGLHRLRPGQEPPVLDDQAETESDEAAIREVFDFAEGLCTLEISKDASAPELPAPNPPPPKFPSLRPPHRPRLNSPRPTL
jgi:hypothetical protein